MQVVVGVSGRNLRPSSELLSDAINPGACTLGKKEARHTIRCPPSLWIDPPDFIRCFRTPTRPLGDSVTYQIKRNPETAATAHLAARHLPMSKVVGWSVDWWKQTQCSTNSTRHTRHASICTPGRHLDIKGCEGRLVRMRIYFLAAHDTKWPRMPAHQTGGRAGDRVAGFNGAYRNVCNAWLRTISSIIIHHIISCYHCRTNSDTDCSV